MSEYRFEKDPMGEVKIPMEAYWGAQPQRAIENFPVSGIVFSPVFIRSLGIMKHACAGVNREFRLLESRVADAIIRSSDEVAQGKFDGQFPIDICQTGSGTSTNMNALDLSIPVQRYLSTPMEGFLTVQNTSDSGCMIQAFSVSCLY